MRKVHTSYEVLHFPNSSIDIVLLGHAELRFIITHRMKQPTFVILHLLSFSFHVPPLLGRVATSFSMTLCLGSKRSLPRADAFSNFGQWVGFVWRRPLSHSSPIKSPICLSVDNSLPGQYTAVTPLHWPESCSNKQVKIRGTEFCFDWS